MQNGYLESVTKHLKISDVNNSMLVILFCSRSNCRITVETGDTEYFQSCLVISYHSNKVT